MDEHPGAGPPDRPLSGLGRFAGKILLGTILAVAGVLLVLRAGQGGGARFAPPPDALAVNERSRPTGSGDPATSPAAAEARARARADVYEAAPATSGPAVGDVARDVERRLAAGELSDAQRRFEPCPGGDLRRTAWIDSHQRVRKLERLRSEDLRIEEWFDESGALREALVRSTAAGSTWLRRVSLDERGVLTTDESTGASGAEWRWPELVRSDPAGAFFDAPGCRR
jgi:hypothetical protein